MKKFTKGVRGSISLFLSMIILLLVILEGFLIDGSKILAGKSKLSDAGDLALNAGLTYYDEALRDIYGLFAISETEDELRDNLEKHIRRTLGESVGYADEENLKSIMEFVDKIIQDETGDVPIGNLLNMKMEEGSLAVIKVPESTLSNHYVIKQQILEYMKYRGPATLGYGILEKLNMFKDIKSQQEVMEKKLDYEEKLSDIEKLCEDVYKALNPDDKGDAETYNGLLDGVLEPGHVEGTSVSINANLQRAVQGTWCYSLLMRDFNLEKNWHQKNDYRGMDVEECIEECSLLANLSICETAAKANLNDSGMSTKIDGGMAAVQAGLGYVEEYDKYRNLYTAMENYKEDYKEKKEKIKDEIDELEEEDEPDEEAIEALQDELDELIEEYERIRGIFEEKEDLINDLADILDFARGKMKEAVDDEMTGARVGLELLRDQAKSLKTMAEDGQKAIVKLKKGLKDAKEAGGKWDESINKLSAGDVKTSMKSDYISEAKALDEEKIDKLNEKLEKGKQYADQLIAAIENTKAVNFQAVSGGAPAEIMRSNFDNSSYGGDTDSAVGGGYANFDRNFYVECALETNAKSDGTITVYLVENPGGGKVSGEYMSMDLSTVKADFDNISAKNDEFYKYLERTCKKKDTDSNAKKDAQGAKETLLEKGGQEFKAEGINVSLNKGSAEKTGEFDKTDKGADDKTVSQKAKDNSKASANMFEKIGELLTSGRNKMYISQYAMEMFSCYTSDKTEGARTLSAYPFSPNNNVMYRAEAEYILWGDPVGQKDVNYTIASIFGIRFLLNTLYAFTGDPEIRATSLAMATAIAGWTGFGVPLVQSVIIIGFALAETACDMKELLDGKDVPIYKSTTTWIIKPSGFTKAAIQEAVNKTVDTGKEYLFNKLNELTESTKEEFKTSLEEYSEETVNTIVDAAVGNVLNPMQKCMLSMVNTISPSREDIAAKVDEAVSAAREAAAGQEESVARDISQKAIELFNDSGYKSQLVNKIASLQQQAYANNGIDPAALQQEIDSYFTSTKDNLENSLRAAAKGMVDPLVAKVSKTVDEANEKIQEKTSDAVDEMMVKINGGINDYKEEDVVIPDGGKGKTSGAAALTMNYKEYVSVFIALECAREGGEEKILQRISDLIEANLASSATKPSPNFKMSEAATMLELKTSAEIKTTFFAMPVPMSSGGSKVLGQDKYSLSYHGILGY